MQTDTTKDLRFNYTVNLLDGGLYGLAIGFASFSTVIPLFIATMTDSAVLIGLVLSLHTMSWQLPQLLYARKTSQLTNFKDKAMKFTIHERLPFLGMALTAFFRPHLGNSVALGLTFIMLLWQGFGAGFTANPWQNMINKVIPPDYLATFFGLQSAAANLLSSGGAIVAGIIMARFSYPNNYSLSFGIAFGVVMLSYFAMNLTRESSHDLTPAIQNQPPLWDSILSILKTDSNFNWLLVSRSLAQLGMMAASFYSVYMVKKLGATELEAGIFTSVLMISGVVSNVALGWLSDHWSRMRSLEIGFLGILLSALVARFAPNINWFYLVMFLLGAANTALFPIMMAFTLQFGDDARRPTYVGMANTLITPVTVIAPILGGWLANTINYQATFLTSAIFGGLALLVLHFFVRDPKPKLSRQRQA